MRTTRLTRTVNARKYRSTDENQGAGFSGRNPVQTGIYDYDLPNDLATMNSDISAPNNVKPRPSTAS